MGLWADTDREDDLLKAGLRATENLALPGISSDPEAAGHVSWISVWGRWLMWLVVTYLLLNRPDSWNPEDSAYLAVPILLFVINGLLHYRLLVKRTVNWRWLLCLSVTDIALITIGISLGDGFSSLIFLFYYPALVIFAVVFPSLWLTLLWTTSTVALYIVVCLLTGSGDLDTSAERELITRLAVLYSLVIGVSKITQFERERWKAAVSREAAAA